MENKLRKAHFQLNDIVFWLWVAVASGSCRFVVVFVCNVQRATCNLPLATGNGQQATGGWGNSIQFRRLMLQLSTKLQTKTLVNERCSLPPSPISYISSQL